MTNLSSLTNLTTTASGLSNLILVVPQTVYGYQPQNPSSKSGNPSQQPPALLFHYEGEQTVQIQSDITDHFIEDNTAIQDQIALKPEIITTRGFIGELNNVLPGNNAILNGLKTTVDKLTAISYYQPKLSIDAQNAYNIAFQSYQALASVANASVATYSTITGAGDANIIGANGIQGSNSKAKNLNQNKQQTAFQQFYGYWRKRTLFSVQTPWAIFQNMAILNLRAIQDADTRVITDFEITFKMIRTTKTEALGALNSKFQGRADLQASSVDNTGTSTPIADRSLNSALSSVFPGTFGGL